MNYRQKEFAHLLSMMFRPHPWHGVSPGDETPNAVASFIEIVPTDAVKLELNKGSGHLSVDRPQLFSSMCPTLYGFIPQTYCGDKIGAFCAKQTKRKNIVGDGDPLDICVLTEKNFAHGDLFVRARPIGGLRMIDGGEADDKIIAVLEQDVEYGHVTDISQLPAGVVERLKHYFLTYKQLPDQKGARKVQIPHIYGRKEALTVIRASLEDYNDKFGRPEDRLEQLRVLLAEAILPELQKMTATAKAGAPSKQRQPQPKKTSPKKNAGKSKDRQSKSGKK